MGTEMSSTKSHSPFGATLSIVSVAISRKAVSSLRTMRGVKPRLISRRSWVCRGSSSSIRGSLTMLPGRTPPPEQKIGWFLET